MKKLVYIVLICLCCGKMAAADMSYYFKTMPDSLLPSTLSMRLDLMDFYQDGLKSSVKGAFDNIMEIKQMSSNSLLLQTTPLSTWQIKVFPLNDSLNVLALIQTVSGPVKSSRLVFYTDSWQPVTDSYIVPQPKSSDFWNLEVLDTLSVEMSPAAICEPIYYEYVFLPENDLLEVRSSAPDYLGREIFERVSSAFIGSYRCAWTVKGFNIHFF